MLFGIDERARRHVLLIADRHALLHGAAQLEEALAQFVGGQFVDGAQAAVAEVVDVVDVPLAGAQFEDVLIALRKSSARSVISVFGMS